MLVLSRLKGERIILMCECGIEIAVEVTAILGNKVRLGIIAPNDVVIRRPEQGPWEKAP